MDLEKRNLESISYREFPVIILYNRESGLVYNKDPKS